MQKFIFVLLVTLGAVCFTRQSYSQGTLAPLYLSTTGSGSITPLQDGQLLEVGQSYDMTAVPDSGFVFSSWQPANVFVLTEVVNDGSGDLVTNTSVTTSLTLDYIEPASLTFTMQAVIFLEDSPSRTLTQNSGWQANFVLVPEPSAITLTACGFITLVLLRQRRPCCLL